MQSLTKLWSDRSLKFKLTALFLTVGILPVAIAGFLAARMASDSLHEDAEGSVADLAYNAMDKLDRNLFERYGDVQAFANSDPARSMDQARLTSFMETMTGIYTPIYKLMVVADAQGKVVAASPIGLDGKPINSGGLIGRDVSKEAWFEKAASGQLKAGETLVEDVREDSLMAAVYGQGESSLAMSFTYPIRDAGGKLLGVWTNRFNWEVTTTVLNEVLERAKAGGATSAAITLVNSEGVILAGAKPEDTLTRNVAEEPAVAAALEEKATGALGGESLDAEGRSSILGFFHSAGYSTYPGIGWGIIAGQDRSEALAAASDITRTLTLIALGAAAIVFVAGFLFASNIAKGIRAILERLQSIASTDAPELQKGIRAVADGDLTVSVNTTTQPVAKYGGDEVGQAARAINDTLTSVNETVASYNDMRAGLNTVIGGMRTSSTSMLSASDQLRAASDQMAQASGQIATAIGEVARSATSVSGLAHETVQEIERLAAGTNELSAAARENAGSAAQSRVAAAEIGDRIGAVATASEHVASAAAASRERAVQGQRAVTEAVGAMEAIASAVDRASATVHELGALGDQIGEIVQTIDQIAAQTNLLALNAAIEAARAGEQGRGFAVVADNVRSLAERSSLATREIADLINKVQAGTQDAVSAMAAGVADVQRGREITTEAGSALDAIISSVQESAVQMQQIAADIQGLTAGAGQILESADAIASSAEESARGAVDMESGTDRVNDAILQVSATSEETAASVEEVSAATEQLSAQSEELAATASEVRDLADGLNAVAAKFRLAA